MAFIDDGTGKGYAAKVDDEFKLQTRAVSQSALLALTVKGRTFSYASQVITLTSANESIIALLENNGSDEVIFSSVNVYIGTSTGGNSDCLVKTYQLVTSSTASNAITALPSKSTNAIDATDIAVYYGAEAATQTGGVNLGGVEIVQHKTAHSIIQNESSAFFLPAGAKIALGITPPTSNTSMIVSFDGLIHINDGSI